MEEPQPQHHRIASLHMHMLLATKEKQKKIHFQNVTKIETRYSCYLLQSQIKSASPPWHIRAP